jgi:AraC family transcriptional regulator of adaptative response/methylated-DNA-[protein]-cysteine methyltransferase
MNAITQATPAVKMHETLAHDTLDCDTMNTDRMWDAVVARDASADGRFVYAVTSTGIYCRPSCSSRRPRRENVQFFDLPQAARQAGFRACKRCHPDTQVFADPQVERVRLACRFIEQWLDDGEEGIPTLERMASEVGGSLHHLQRTFKRLLGVSPAEYADARRLVRLREGLKAGNGVTGAIYDAGYGAASRVYEKAAGKLGMTPATYARGGKGAEVAYTIVDTPLDRLLVAATRSGVCFLSLGDDDAQLVDALRRELPFAEIRRDDEVLSDWVAIVVDYLEGRSPHPELPLDVQGTAFQRRVWQELMKIPAGVTASYSELAERVTGDAGARRAIARSCATNPVPLVIPCHRVLRSDGNLGGYRWGLDRKRALLAGEHAQTSHGEAD